MTINLIHILSDIKSLIDYWNGNGFITEEEMVAQLEKYNKKLTEALGNEKFSGAQSR